jgi:hypothetical protein
MTSDHERDHGIHVCMKVPCAYCAARANAVHPPDTAGGYSDLMTAVANELRRRTVTDRASRKDRRSRDRSSEHKDSPDR